MAFVRSLIQCHRFQNIVPRVAQRSLVGVLSVTDVKFRCLHQEINYKLEAKLRKRDGLGEDWKIVYRAPYEIYCKIAYSACIISSTAFPSVIASLFYTFGYGNYPMKIGEMTVVNSDMEMLAFAFGLLVLIGNTSLVVFRYPFRIYRSTLSDKYALIFQHVIPWKYRVEEMKAGDLKRDTEAFFSWNESLYKFGDKDKGAILLENCFQRPADLSEMLGENKNVNKT